MTSLKAFEVFWKTHWLWIYQSLKVIQMSICRKSGVGLICLSNFKLNHSKTCQLFLNPLVRWMPTQLAQLFPVTKKTSETEPLSRPKSIIWGERLSRRPLAAHNCLQNPQSHICGLLQNLAEQFQLLTAIAQTGSYNELCGGWVVIERGGGGGTKGGVGHLHWSKCTAVSESRQQCIPMILLCNLQTKENFQVENW